MYFSSTFFFTAVVALARITVATPPGCLLAALGVQPNPGDLVALCGSLEPQLAGNITEKCSGADESAAISLYAATCLSAESVTISINTASSTTASTTATGTAKAGTTTTISGSSTPAATKKSGADSVMRPQSAFIVAPIAIAAGFIGQYLL